MGSKLAVPHHSWTYFKGQVRRMASQGRVRTRTSVSLC